MNLFKKLSTAEARRLTAFLESVACPPDTMSLMEIKGFLFALCCAPTVSKPSVWIPEIFNHRPPNFATSEEEEFINTALVRLYNQLMADINEGTPVLPATCKYREPCASNFERGAPLHEWCKGFNEAHHLFFEHWEAGIGDDDELMAAVGFMVLTLGFFDDRDESRQMLDMAFDVDLPLHEMAPIVRAQMPQVMKEYARIGRAMYEEMLEEESASPAPGKGAPAASNVVPFRVPHREDDARDRQLQAEELAIQALEETNHEKRVALARKALTVSDDCSRALSLLAEDAAESLEESADYYRRAMDAAKRTLGARAFAEAEGHFWGVLETRPYMHAKMGYADTLWALERTSEALHEYEEMLRLNPADNQGARYVLVVRYLDAGELAKTRKLLDEYQEDGTWWHYNDALYWWMAKGDCPQGRKSRTAGLKANPYVLDYFSGKRRMPKSLPEFYAWGSVEEAVLYAHEARMTWRAKPGAVEWLKAGTQKTTTQKKADSIRKLMAGNAKAGNVKSGSAKATAASKGKTSTAGKGKAASKASAPAKDTPSRKPSVRKTPAAVVKTPSGKSPSGKSGKKS